MHLDEALFESILGELIAENPIAVRAVLRILQTEYTDQVPTIAVTLEEPPRLLVNLGFLREHCATEDHVKAVILHEFLHVVLGHTERFKTMTFIQNVALDAVINAIIHRTAGPSFSSFFGRFYTEPGMLSRLLRPPQGFDAVVPWSSLERDSIPDEEADFRSLWASLYAGRLVADDVLDLAKDLPHPLDPSTAAMPILIGNHDDGRPVPETLRKAIESALKQMNGSGIWRAPMSRGFSGPLTEFAMAREPKAIVKWKAETRRLLRECLIPDRHSILREQQADSFRLPVLSPRDRRAFLRTLWSPILPEAEWSTERMASLGRANVYLDVSGSMNVEMEHLLPLLWSLRRAIAQPFWAFSTEVAPARLANGKLVTQTTGGTSIACVLEHLAKTVPAAALIVTDGYIEPVPQQLLNRVKDIKIRVLVSRNGTTSELDRAGMTYRQLGRLPQ